MAEFDIVIPHWGEGLLTDICRLCLAAVADGGGDFRVILIDNGSPEIDRLKPELARMDHTVIRNSENAGYVRAANQGMQFSTAPYVVLLNNDTLPPPGWLNQLRLAFKLHADAGIAGPLTDTRASWQGCWQRRGTGVHLLHRGGMLAFFCAMIKRSVIDKIGYLDEGFGVGLGDDDEYCHRAERAGFRLCLCQGLTVPHRHRTSFLVRYTPDEIQTMQAAAMRRVLASKEGHDGRR